MLSISNPIHGAKALGYYLSLCTADYYLATSDATWDGEAASRLGLPGKIDRDQFRNLFLGFTPNGKDQLVQNAGKENHVAAWDLTFSAPKDVSVLWSQVSGSTRKLIEKAHREAVGKALSYLEGVAGNTRRGKGGEVIEKASLLFGLFHHFTSRAQDPQIHTHALLFNLTVRNDGTTGSFASKNLFDHKMAAGALYRAHLASNLHRELGLEILPAKNGFEIAGVSRELVREFSKRRHQIESELNDQGRMGAVASKIATLATRPAKVELPAAQLFADWHAAGRRLGWSTSQADALIQAPKERLPVDLSAQASKARHEVISRQGSFSERDLVAKVATSALKNKGNAEDVLSAVKRELRCRDIVRDGQSSGDINYTTKSVRREQKIVTQILTEADRSGAHKIERSLFDETPKPQLSKKANEALAQLLLHEAGLPSLLTRQEKETPAVLREASNIWKRAGFTVLGFSPSKRAGERLQAELGLPTIPFKEIANFGLFSIYRKERSLLRRRTSLPHLELKLPSIGIKIKNPILIFDLKGKPS